MYYKILMRQSNVMRKTVIVEADDESSARRTAFLQDSGLDYKLDTSERRRRYIETITPLRLEEHDV